MRNIIKIFFEIKLLFYTNIDFFFFFLFVSLSLFFHFFDLSNKKKFFVAIASKSSS